MPSAIEQVHQDYRGRGLAVLAIDIQEEREKVHAWVERHLVSVPVVLDRDGGVTRRYDVTATPTAFVVTRDGAIVGKALGAKAWTSPAGRALIEALLAQ